MVSYCANPKCAKPLHYLREGRIFVFDTPGREGPQGAGDSRKLEHFWLCGECSRTMALERNAEGVRLIPRLRMGPQQVDDAGEEAALAS
jgi:hypothetical protein